MSFLASLAQRFSHIALFILCELIAFILIINFNQKQRDIFLHSSSLMSGSLLKKTSELKDYMSLQQSNADLLKENARLLQEIISMPRSEVPTPDSNQLAYDVIPAHVINNSILSIRNHFTIDKGSIDGVQPSMGVVTLGGIAGIVKSVNERYATVISLVNVDVRVSASIADKDYFGTVSWDGQAYSSLILNAIPTHADINIGDKIVTNGYSTIFPPGLDVGEVLSFDINKNGAFYDVAIKPHVDFSSLDYVYVLKGNFAKELISLIEDE